MTRERFIGIQRAALVTIIKKKKNTTIPDDQRKRINKCIYRRDFTLSKVAKDQGGYHSMYDHTLRNIHQCMMRGEI